MPGGLPVHVVQRGNNRSACFFEPQDRDFYLFHLSRLLPRSRCALHAYCLMTNHVHLLLTPAEPGACAYLMKRVGQLYAQYVNRRYKRSGTLWEGRFKSCVVQSERYLLSCYRYIELNPVRAGLCQHPRDYPWSSYRRNVGDSPGTLLTPHEEFTRLGGASAYAELLEHELDGARLDEIRSATHGNFALGDASFKQRLATALGRRVERGTPGRPSLEREKRGPSLI